MCDKFCLTSMFAIKIIQHRLENNLFEFKIP